MGALPNWVTLCIWSAPTALPLSQERRKRASHGPPGAAHAARPSAPASRNRAVRSARAEIAPLAPFDLVRLHTEQDPGEAPVPALGVAHLEREAATGAAGVDPGPPDSAVVETLHQDVDEGA